MWLHKLFCKHLSYIHADFATSDLNQNRCLSCLVVKFGKSTMKFRFPKFSFYNRNKKSINTLLYGYDINVFF